MLPAVGNPRGQPHLAPLCTPSLKSQVRQTFLEPVEWQVSVIRDTFLSALSRDSFFGYGSSGSPKRALASLPGSSDPLGTTGPFPRPSVLAEIIQGDGGGGGGASTNVPQGFAEEEEAVEGRGTGGRVEGRRKQGEKKDFDFREAFAVYEDRDLLACSPLREVSYGPQCTRTSAAQRHGRNVQHCCFRACCSRCCCP